jgi:hypothetical protein
MFSINLLPRSFVSDGGRITRAMQSTRRELDFHPSGRQTHPADVRTTRPNMQSRVLIRTTLRFGLIMQRVLTTSSGFARRRA